MGEKVSAIFDYVQQKGRFISVMRLAMATQITRPMAHTVPENPEIVKMVREAAKNILAVDAIPV